MTHHELHDLARELDASGASYALVTVVRAIAPTSAYVGAQAIVRADGTLHGWIGGGCAKDVVIAAAREAIDGGAPKLVRISNDQLQSDADIEQHAMSCASNGTLELFIQPYGARRVLCVLGATPAADEARFLAERLQIGLAVDPTAAPIVLIATQGQGDEDALERALRSKAAHVLMISSRRKAERLRAAMRLRGIGEAQLERLTAPAGPDAGAKTPAEIALVAIVGVLAILRGKASAATSMRSAAAKPDSATTTDSNVVPALDTRVANTSQPQAGVVAAGRFVNPVCGIAIDTSAPKHVERYEGVDYYFCCDCCWTAFREAPAKFAAIHRASAGQVPA